MVVLYRRRNDALQLVPLVAFAIAAPYFLHVVGILGTREIGIVAAAIEVTSLCIYILAIFGWEIEWQRMHLNRLIEPTRPNSATWITWFVMNSLILASSSYGPTGAGEGSWTLWSYEFMYALVIVSSLLKQAFTKWGAKEWLCLAGTSVGATLWFVLWYVFGTTFEYAALTALVVGGSVDMIGAIPTARNAWKWPQNESRDAWTTGFISGVVNIFAVDVWSWNTMSSWFFPFYNLLILSLIAGAIWFSPKR